MQRDALSRYSNVDERLGNLESTPSRSAPASANSRANPIANSAPNSTANPIARPTASANSGGNAPIAASNNPLRPTPTAGTNTSPVDTEQPLTGNAYPNVNANNRAPSTRNIGRGVLEPAVLSEQQLYQMAYDSVIKSNFDLSIAEFDQYLSIYPEGRFVTNAYYWKGQAYLYLNRYREAVESYEVIVNQQQDSSKLPDAMYGLALAYEGMGNKSQARQILNNIKIIIL